MSAPAVLVLSTLDTKAEETEHLTTLLTAKGLVSQTIDLSLGSGGVVLGGAEKVQAMEAAADHAIEQVTMALGEGVQAVLGIGGGTGGEIALRVLKTLPITFPKVLVTTLPFDPRVAVADTSIILVPTLADICGLNATLREVLENVASMMVGLCATARASGACLAQPSVGITGLGATDLAVQGLVAGLKTRGQESTVFHSNGYGGAAFARFARRGAFHAIVDLTPHELTRLHIAGAHVPMPDRFSAAPDLPRVVLPGALNFIGLGQLSLLPERYLGRPHYAHSGYFTHVKVSPDEMRRMVDVLAAELNALTGPVCVIAPMGGFSHQDAPGGAIEDADLRHVFLDRARERLSARIRITPVSAHISAPEVTDHILTELDALGARTKD